MFESLDASRKENVGRPSSAAEDCLLRTHTHTHTNGTDARAEARRDTYDITTGTWRIKPCTAYVMRGPAGSYARRP